MLDSEPTEPLSVDGNSSELDMEDLEEEEKESLKKTEICSSVPETPDQEAFLKKNFANLSDFSTSGHFFVCLWEKSSFFTLIISLQMIVMLSLFCGNTGSPNSSLEKAITNSVSISSKFLTGSNSW